mmetsp:Transcript_67437/g.208633  ORF Transcript_67437/g.208633 Transcript_67437/m.208633 type:complete len:199 (+) Transcript_67437:154-750(+)
MHLHRRCRAVRAPLSPARVLVVGALVVASLHAALRGHVFAVAPRRSLLASSSGPSLQVRGRSGSRMRQAVGPADGQGRKWSREELVKLSAGALAFGLSSFLLPPDLKYATVCYRSKQYTREYWDNPLNVAYAKSKGMTQEEFAKMYLDDPMCEELGSLAERYGKFFSGQEHQRTDIPPEKRITKNTQFGFWFQRPPKE